MSTEIPAHPAIWSRLQTEWQTGRLPHALLFVGAAGLGKAATAWRLAARMLGRELRVTPTDEWPKDAFYLADEADFFIVSPQGSEIKIGQIRAVEKALSRTHAGARVVVLQAADRLNVAAANALLKTLEEPPENTYFILLAQSDTGLLPTIRSRVVRYAFAAYDAQTFAAWLGAQKRSSKEAQMLFAVSEGNPGLAVALLQGDLKASADAALTFFETLGASSTPYLDLSALWQAHERADLAVYIHWLEWVAHDLAILITTDNVTLLRLPFVENRLRKIAADWDATTILEVTPILREALRANELNIATKLIGDMVILELNTLVERSRHANRSRSTL